MKANLRNVSERWRTMDRDEEWNEETGRPSPWVFLVRCDYLRAGLQVSVTWRAGPQVLGISGGLGPRCQVPDVLGPRCQVPWRGGPQVSGTCRAGPFVSSIRNSFFLLSLKFVKVGEAKSLNPEPATCERSDLVFQYQTWSMETDARNSYGYSMEVPSELEGLHACWVL